MGEPLRNFNEWSITKGPMQNLYSMFLKNGEYITYIQRVCQQFAKENKQKRDKDFQLSKEVSKQIMIRLKENEDWNLAAKVLFAMYTGKGAFSGKMEETFVRRNLRHYKSYS